LKFCRTFSELNKKVAYVTKGKVEQLEGKNEAFIEKAHKQQLEV
jgi:hypothetical protein